MRLKTDFMDVGVDHAFHGHWRLYQPVFERMAETTRTRKEDHDLLEEIGYRLPLRGKLEDVVSRVSPNDFLVTYWDQKKHRADGKSRVQAWSAYMVAKPETYTCKWMGPIGQSVRILAVGKRIFWLLYTSKTSHFSNVNTDTIDLVAPAVSWGRNAELDLFRLQQRLKQPLVAVDLVLEKQAGYAIDLNVSPGLTGTPVLDILKPQEIHDLIEARWHELRKQ